MNFKDWWEHNKSEYFYSEEDLAEDAYVTGYSEKQAELVSAQARIAELEEQIDLQIPKGVMLGQMARIAELQEFVSKLINVTPGHAGQCSGLKCREPYCYSCNGEDDANEYLQNVWDLCGEAKEALSRTDDLSALQELRVGYEARIAELLGECEYDQRNAAMSQKEAAALLDKCAEYEAQISGRDLAAAQALRRIAEGEK